MTNYYDGARAKEYRRAMRAPQSPVDPGPTLGELLEANRQTEELPMSVCERRELHRLIKDRIFGAGRDVRQWGTMDGEAEVMDAELVDDDS